MFRQSVRVSLYLILLVIVVVGGILVQQSNLALSDTNRALEEKTHTLQSYVMVSGKIRALEADLSKYEDAGIPIETAKSTLITLHNYLEFGRFAEAITLVDSTSSTLIALYTAKQEEAALAEAARVTAAQKEAEAEAKKGDLTGIIKSAIGVLSDATVTIQVGEQPVSSVVTGADGVYRFHIDAGTYILDVKRTGYIGQQRDMVSITAGNTAQTDFVLEKVVVTPKKTTPTPTATPTPTTSSTTSSTAYSTYVSKTVSTERGVFSVKVLAVDFSSGHVKAVTDTAADGDCLDNCPVKSLKDFVSQSGGFAGINGTYFCPTAYADCAGKTNSFYWKMFNPRINLMVNKDNLLGEQDPFLTFDTNNKPHLYTTWTQHSSSFGLSAGISCRPLLVSGSQNVLKDSDLDDKQRTAKTARAALGVNGDTVYAVVVSGATVTDLAAVMTELGVASSFNIDGGGSTALYYNGVYKAGPGRNLPNALVFVEVP